LVSHENKKKETDMTMFRNGAFAVALLGGVAFAPAVQAVDAGVDVDHDDDVIIEHDRPALLPRNRGAEVYVEPEEPDVYVEEEDDDDIDVPGASVEVDPD
jgi:hypothetical protein